MGVIAGDASLSVSMARPSGSFVAAAYACWACCGLRWLPKNTSGLVHADTARRMPVERYVKPTWYAAGRKRVGDQEQIRFVIGVDATHRSSNQSLPLAPS